MCQVFIYLYTFVSGTWDGGAVRPGEAVIINATPSL